MKSVSEILGRWEDPNWDSGLIQRVKAAWNKPAEELSNEDLATFLWQNIAAEYLLPIAQQRINENYEDDSEMYVGELKEAVLAANKRRQFDPPNGSDSHH
jgi:hypothetical protein